MDNVQPTSSALTQYSIAFTIRDGEHEYSGNTLLNLDHESNEQEQVRQVWSEYAYDDRDESAWKSAWKAYKKNGCLSCDDDERIFKDISLSIQTGLLEACKLARETLLNIRSNNEHGGLDSVFVNMDIKMLDSAIAEAEAHS